MKKLLIIAAPLIVVGATFLGMESASAAQAGRYLLGGRY